MHFETGGVFAGSCTVRAGHFLPRGVDLDVVFHVVLSLHDLVAHGAPPLSPHFVHVLVHFPTCNMALYSLLLCTPDPTRLNNSRFRHQRGLIVESLVWDRGIDVLQAAVLGDDEAGPVVVPVERPGVGAETRSRGEHPAAQAARELDVVYMLGFQVVLALKVGTQL